MENHYNEKYQNNTENATVFVFISSICFGIIKSPPSGTYNLFLKTGGIIVHASQYDKARSLFGVIKHKLVAEHLSRNVSYLKYYWKKKNSNKTCF